MEGLEILAVLLHVSSVICLLLLIYLTYHGNKLVTIFALANIGQHGSKLFRLLFFGFKMENAPVWACYFHAFTNFLTTGMEAHISFIFTVRLWLMITKKNSIKLWLLERVKYLSYIVGLLIPFLLAWTSVVPQFIEGNSITLLNHRDNCVAGLRTNAWQIAMSGMGTTIPPLIPSLLMGANIFYVMCIVSTKTLMKDVKKFSTISYSSWIRMLYFGLLFGVVVSINIIGDITNIKNMVKNNTPEPAPGLGVPYLLTACVGILVLLIFGTTVEAKKKISSLLKKSFSNVASGFTSTFTGSNSKSVSKFEPKSSNSSVLTYKATVGLNNNNRKSNSTLTLTNNNTNASAELLSFNGIKQMKDDMKEFKLRNRDEFETNEEFNNFMKSLTRKPAEMSSDGNTTINVNNEYEYDYKGIHNHDPSNDYIHKGNDKVFNINDNSSSTILNISSPKIAPSYQMIANDAYQPLEPAAKPSSLRMYKPILKIPKSFQYNNNNNYNNIINNNIVNNKNININNSPNINYNDYNQFSIKNSSEKKYYEDKDELISKNSKIKDINYSDYIKTRNNEKDITSPISPGSSNINYSYLNSNKEDMNNSYNKNRVVKGKYKEEIIYPAKATGRILKSYTNANF